jgi:REP element-mobilizing transposase RayT
MGRRIRYLPPEGSGLVEVTCRTIQGRFLLTPSNELNEIILGALGRAQELYPVGICTFAFASNHFHLLLRVESTHRLALFMGHFNSNLAREAGRLIHWREKFWGRRYQAIPVSEEEAARRSSASSVDVARTNETPSASSDWRSKMLLLGRSRLQPRS